MVYSHHQAADNRKYEGRGGVSDTYSGELRLTPTSLSSSSSSVYYSFTFGLHIPKGEHVRNLLLRLHTIVRREYFPVGLERRVRVLVDRGVSDLKKNPSTSNKNKIKHKYEFSHVIKNITRTPISGRRTERHISVNRSNGSSVIKSSKINDVTGRRLIEVSRKDVYLHNHAWLSFNIKPALKHIGQKSRLKREAGRNESRSRDFSGISNRLVLVVQIERVFASVGDQGRLEVDLTPDIDIRPLVLMYSSQVPALRRKIRHQRGSSSRSTRIPRDTEWVGEDEVEDGDEVEAASGREGDSGRKGRKGGRRRQILCKRRPLKVDFESIGWGDWVIAPVEYEAYQCTGKCFYPLASHLNPTTHAVIQTLMHSRSTERARRACCVPTLLGPISLLYFEDGIATYKKEYDDMVALECGCR